MMASRPVDVPALVDAARAGAPRAVARLISLVEDGHPALREVMSALAPHTGRAHIFGITGSPGVGKSTLTNALVGALRARGQRVGILAVDPSSPFSGGALLGDRIRMQDHATDNHVFIRSMATRGHLGGLSLAVPDALRVLGAASFPFAFVETVGVGQMEVEIASAADTTVVVTNPGWGDSMQANKAGLLEVADIFVINKADRPGVKETRRDLEQMLDLGRAHEWRPVIVETTATSDEGTDALFDAIDAHRRFLDRDLLARARRQRTRAELDKVVGAVVRSRIAQLAHESAYEAQIDALVEGLTDPYSAAEVLLDES